jgi:hypothetical protein
MAKTKNADDTTNHFPLPVVDHNGYKWGALSYFGNKQIISAETFRTDDDKYSFRGGHRVRLYELKNNIYWRIPAGVELDISMVMPAEPPRRIVR